MKKSKITKILMIVSVLLMIAVPAKICAEPSGWILKTLDGRTLSSDGFAEEYQLYIFVKASSDIMDMDQDVLNSSFLNMSLDECDWAGTENLKVIVVEASGADSETTRNFFVNRMTNKDIEYCYGGREMMLSLHENKEPMYTYCVLMKDGAVIHEEDKVSNESQVKEFTLLYMSGYVDSEHIGTFGVSGTDHYEISAELVKRINQKRKEAGVSEVLMDEMLTETAMQRAAECLVLNRTMASPDGRNTFHGYRYYAFAEGNLYNYGDPDPDKIWDWLKNNSFLTDEFGAAGIGCFSKDDVVIVYVVMLDTVSYPCRKADPEENTHTIRSYKEYLNLSLAENQIVLPVGETKKLTLHNTNAYGVTYDIDPSFLMSSDSDVIQIREDGTAKALKDGAARLCLGVSEAIYLEAEVTAAEVKRISMHRLYNPNSWEHFYTGNTKERDALVKLGWQYEGVGWTAPDLSNTPVYRLYNPNSGGDHHYTMNRKEYDALIKAGWTGEGIRWYSDDAKGVSVYREYNYKTSIRNHNYTANKKEHEYLVKTAGWNDEGIGWYGLK